MTLRTKTLSIVGLVLTVLLVALSGIVTSIVLNRFLSLEQQNVELNVLRAIEAFEGEQGKIISTARDWALWDANYDFVGGSNPSFIENELGYDIIANLGINLALFYNMSNMPIHNMAIDLMAETELPVPESLSQEFTADHPLFINKSMEQQAVSGFLLLPESPVIIVSHAILTSEGGGPPAGSLIMGRYLDAETIQQVEKQTQLTLSVTRVDTPNLSVEQAEIILSLQSQIDKNPDVHAILTVPIDRDTISGYALFYDVHGKPALLLRVDIIRKVYQQGLTSITLLIISLLAVGVAFIGLLLFILERLILSRLVQLSRGVAHIGASGDMSKRLSLAGEDELSGVATSINKMLQDLQDSQQREIVLKQEVQRLRIEIDKTRQHEEVKEIVDTDFFRDLQTKARDIRRRHRGDEEDETEI